MFLLTITDIEQALMEYGRNMDNLAEIRQPMTIEMPNKYNEDVLRLQQIRVNDNARIDILTQQAQFWTGARVSRARSHEDICAQRKFIATELRK